MKYVLLDGRMPAEYAKAFVARGLVPLMLTPCERLDAPVSSHPDMLAANVSGHLLLEKRYCEENRELFAGLPFIVTDETLSKKYPSDILLNALEVNGTVYGRDEVSAVIKSAADRFVRIKQGYARCSTLMLDCAAVTADVTIAKALSVNGIDVMKITPGHISLEGYSYGFIGGASAVVGNEVLFFGDITRHPDHAAIMSFIASHGYTAVSLSDDMLYDYGGAVIVEAQIS